MDFEKLKSSYILSIQSGLLAGVGYEDIKNANKVINHFCKYYTSIARRGYESEQSVQTRGTATDSYGH